MHHLRLKNPGRQLITIGVSVRDGQVNLETHAYSRVSHDREEGPFVLSYRTISYSVRYDSFYRMYDTILEFSNK